MPEIISSTIVLDTLVGMLIEKAATAIYEKFKKTDKEKTAKMIKEIIDQKIHGNKDYSYLLDWNKAVQVSNLLLLDFLKAEGIYKSLKLYQERHGFYKNDGVLIKSDAELSEVSRDLSNSLRQEVKLKDIVAEFDEEYKKAERDANDERMNTQLDQILSQLDRMQLHDDNDIYLREFSDILFLDKERNRCVTLETMYCSPDISLNNGKVDSAADEIKNWVMHDNDHNVLLLFGDAGVGKSSLCRKMVWDAIMPNNQKKEFCIQKDKIHVIPLRKYLSILEKWEARWGVWELLQNLFKIERTPSRNELFVLDGLDEVEVLCPNFPFNDFFDDLQSFSEYDMKIMITSRKTDHIKECGEKASTQKRSRIQCRTLFWKDETVQNWCEQYSKYRFDLDFDNWMQRFLDFYNELPNGNSNDTRREILRVPIILYIVCNAEVDLQEDSSIGSIYDQAFHTILEREHISNSTMKTVLDGKKAPAEATARQIQWRFTKELAFQMYLHDTLTLSDSEQPDAIANAQKRTIELLKQDGFDISDKFQIDSEAYFAVFHFAKENSDRTGVVFAHKTVYEYFTAVKLYEDYLAMPNIQGTDINQVWKKLSGAFRYKLIDDYVLNYLKSIHSNPDEISFDVLSRSFFEGICEQKILSMPFQDPPVSEYVLENDQILPSIQVHLLFANLTRYFTARGYKNTYLNDTNRINFVACLKILFNMIPAGNNPDNLYDLKNWKLTKCNFQRDTLTYVYLEGTDLRGANLKNASLASSYLIKAHLNHASLQYANLEHVKMSNANLSNASLKGAYMVSAMLQKTILVEAHLEEATLVNALLQMANMEKAHLEGADLRSATLSGANLKNAHLEGAHLETALLNDTQLEGAHLEGAHLKKTNLEKAHLEGAFYDEKTVFPEGFDPQTHGIERV